MAVDDGRCMIVASSTCFRDKTLPGESPIIIDILKGLLISMPLWPATSVLEH